MFLKKYIYKILAILFVLVFLLVIFIFLKNKKNNQFNPIKIGLITDIHNCAGNNVDLNFFRENASEEKTDFNVSLGDNINFRVGNCSQSYQEDLKGVVEKLNSINQTHFVLGDHDIDNKNETFTFWLEQTKNQKNYYSFDEGDFHIIILDTVMGGEEVKMDCENYDFCLKLQKDYLQLKEIKNNKELFEKYLTENNLKEDDFLKMLEEKKKNYFTEEKNLKSTRSLKKMNEGIVAEEELKWFKEDIQKTDKNKVIVFSHHSVFNFISTEKNYEIENSEKVLEIMKESGKDFVCVSGDKHVWYEEKKDKMHYFIINAYFDKQSYAIFTWDENGYRIEKYTKN